MNLLTWAKTKAIVTTSRNILGKTRTEACWFSFSLCFRMNKATKIDILNIKYIVLTHVIPKRRVCTILLLYKTFSYWTFVLTSKVSFSRVHCIKLAFSCDWVIFWSVVNKKLNFHWVDPIKSSFFFSVDSTRQMYLRGSHSWPTSGS